MQYYGTLGPACGRVETLKEMFKVGMTGVRMNMSHGDLDENGHWLDLLFAAAKECDIEKPQVLIDLRGPELRLGKLEHEFAVAEGEHVPMGKDALPVPQMLIDHAVIGDHILLDDGKLEFEVLSVSANTCAARTDESDAHIAPNAQPDFAHNNHTSHESMSNCGHETMSERRSSFVQTSSANAKVEQSVTGSKSILITKVLRGGQIKSGKSLAIVGKELPMPTLTDHDYKNIRLAAAYGVTGVMQPFVRGKHDLETLRAALREAGAEHVKIFAKIENLQGVASLDELLPYCDHVVIARGDLGNAMPLWELPRIQKTIAAKCRAAGKPFMVVTQMLDSMHERAVPTRAEVLDIYNAVLDGASSLMLTGETAAGNYPAEAMDYLVKTGEEALR